MPIITSRPSPSDPSLNRWLGIWRSIWMGLRAVSIVVYVHPLSRIVDAENIVEREMDTNQSEAIEQDDDGCLKVISIPIGFAQ